MQQPLSCSPSAIVQKRKTSCHAEPTIHAGLDLGLQCHCRSTISLIVVEHTRSGKERKWDLSSRKNARLDAGAMACQHEQVPQSCRGVREPRTPCMHRKVKVCGWGVRCGRSGSELRRLLR